MILGKEKLIFFIETTDGTSLGGFMKKKISGIMRKIGDPDCFLFTNQNNQMKKYQIKKEKKYEVFLLSSKIDSKLFTFGNDLTIYKQDMKNQSIINERDAFFDYGRDKNALLGNSQFCNMTFCTT